MKRGLLFICFTLIIKVCAGADTADDISGQSDHKFDFDSIVTRALQTQAPGTAYFHKIANFTAVNDREEEFGTSVDISGDGTVVAISAIEESSTTADLFHYLVQVWKEGANGNWGKVGSDMKGSDDVEWREDARAHVSISKDGGGGPKLGLKVSFDATGSTLAIGERYYDDTSSNDVGRILVKTIASTSNGEAAVSAKGSDIKGTTSGDHTGSSVIISGDGNCLIFGSTGDDGADDSALQMGSVSIYCFDSGSNSWGSPRAVLHGDAAGDEFGSSVAINNDATYIAVGAIKYDDASAGTNAGSTNGYYVGDYFGYSLDISDLTDDDKIRVVIGAPNNGGTYYHGHARLYEADTTSTDPQWALVASDIDGRDNMSLGKSLAMSKTGERMCLVDQLTTLA